MIKHYSPVSKTYAKIAIPFVVFSIIIAGASVAIACNSTNDTSQTSLDQTKGIGSMEALSGASSSDPYSFNPCDLDVVSCDGSKDRREGDNATDHTSVVAGYSIGSYATIPTHEATVKAIYDAMPEIEDKFDADEYIKSKRPNIFRL